MSDPISLSEAEVTRRIQSIEGVSSVDANGDRFFFYDPDDLQANRKMPFATLVTGDSYDNASNLDRPGVYRLNIGVTKETYRALLGELPAEPAPGDVVDTGHDFSLLNVVLPNPTYGYLAWIAILNPTEERWRELEPLLEEARGVAAERHARRAERG